MIIYLHTACSPLSFEEVQILLQSVNLVVSPSHFHKLPQGVGVACRLDNINSQSLEGIRTKLLPLRHQGVDSGLDINVLPTPLHPADFGLAVFDMDATLLSIETLDELAHRWEDWQKSNPSTPHTDISAEIDNLTNAAMTGKLAFADSLRARLTLLRGLPEKLAKTMIDEGLPLSIGADETLTGLKALEINTMIASGGFLPFADALQKRFGLYKIVCNRWECDSAGCLTGNLVPPIIHAEGKKMAMHDTLHNLYPNLSTAVPTTIPKKSLAVGDGANDLPMLQSADIGVAFRGKPTLRESIALQLNAAPMNALLDFFVPLH